MKKIVTLILILHLKLIISQNSIKKFGDQVFISDYKLNNVSKIEVLKTKLTIVDFWATWCGPCVAALPELESFAKKNKGNIQILAVSNEGTRKVRSYIKNKYSEIIFFSDSANLLWKAFNIQSIPQTIALDSLGKFIWAGSGDNLNEFTKKYFEGTFIAEKDISNMEWRNYSGDFVSVTSSTYTISKPLIKYTIEVGDKNGESSSQSFRGDTTTQKEINIHYLNNTVTELLQNFQNIDDSELINNRKDLDTTFISIRYSINSPSYVHINVAEIYNTILKDINSLYNVNYTKTNKETEVYFLKVSDSVKFNTFLDTTYGGGYTEYKKNRVVYARVTLSHISKNLEKVLTKLPGSKNNRVIFAGDDTMNYTLTTMEFKDFKTLSSALNKVGLKLEKGMANLEYTTMY
jgi:thiol-disulfide isomerase/thioredoxin